MVATTCDHDGFFIEPEGAEGCSQEGSKFHYGTAGIKSALEINGNVRRN
jgi:hypothetical protein